MSMVRSTELSDTIFRFSARTPTLPPASHTNSYALGERDVLLVEPSTPYEDEQREWLAWARSLISQGRRPVAIFVTHHHLDHVGGLRVLAQQLALPVWAHELTASRLGDVAVARTLADGEALVLEGPRSERWAVLHTPGHAPGHLCLWNEESGAVLVGDMVATVGTILVAPGDGDMRMYLEQLARLEALSARVALPAHGEPIERPSGLFRRYVAHRLLREAKVLAAVARHAEMGARPEDLLPDAYADTPVRVWPLALLSLRAHLEKLLDDGRVVARDGRFISV